MRVACTDPAIKKTLFSRQFHVFRGTANTSLSVLCGFKIETKTHWKPKDTLLPIAENSYRVQLSISVLLEKNGGTVLVQGLRDNYPTHFFPLLWSGFVCRNGVNHPCITELRQQPLSLRFHVSRNPMHWEGWHSVVPDPLPQAWEPLQMIVPTMWVCGTFHSKEKACRSHPLQRGSWGWFVCFTLPSKWGIPILLCISQVAFWERLWSKFLHLALTLWISWSKRSIYSRPFNAGSVLPFNKQCRRSLNALLKEISILC